MSLLGRLCLASFFIYEAYDSLKFVKATKLKMTQYGLTWQQDLLFWSAICLLIIGAIFLALGYRARFAAVCLLLYWIPLTFILHPFWQFPGAEQRVHATFFMRDIAIIGGLLMVYVHGSGKYSVKRLLDNRRIKTR